MPPVNAILAWMKVKRISVGKSKTKPIVKKGKKKPLDKQLQSIAFSIAIGIKKKGLKPVDWLAPLGVFQTQKFKQDLHRAIQEDMKEKFINGINNK